MSLGTYKNRETQSEEGDLISTRPKSETIHRTSLFRQTVAAQTSELLGKPTTSTNVTSSRHRPDKWKFSGKSSGAVSVLQVMSAIESNEALSYCARMAPVVSSSMVTIKKSAKAAKTQPRLTKPIMRFPCSRQNRAHSISSLVRIRIIKAAASVLGRAVIAVRPLAADIFEHACKVHQHSDHEGCEGGPERKKIALNGL